MLPIKIIWVVLVVFEVLKLGHMIATNSIKVDGVDINSPAFVPLRYPFVFCSLCMYTYPLFIFKKNKLSDSAMAFSVIPFFITFLAAAINNSNPSYIFEFWHAHSYGFHYLMGAVSVYLITSGLYKFKLKDWFRIFVWFGGYIALSTIISLFIGADMSIFGPESGFVGFLYDGFGYATGNLLLILVIGMLLFAIYGLIHIIGKHRPVKVKKETQNDA